MQANLKENKCKTKHSELSWPEQTLLAYLMAYKRYKLPDIKTVESDSIGPFFL